MRYYRNDLLCKPGDRPVVFIRKDDFDDVSDLNPL